MDQQNAIQFINDRAKGKNVEIPKVLYKYRPFDEFTYDMLENNYMYLCPAKNLDDKSECTSKFDIQDYMNISTEQLTAACVFNILSIIEPHTTEENYRKCQELIARIITPNGLVRNDWLLDAYFEMQELVPNFDIAPIVNWISSIPMQISKKETREKLQEYFIAIKNARRDFGVCSLTITKDNQEMWDEYTKKSTGYCVEYDMVGYEYEKLIYPVAYQDNRQNNIFLALISDFIGQMIEQISCGQIVGDRTKCLRILMTKDASKWYYQEEWRLVGDANDKIKAPKIKAIYLGKNVSFEDKEKMTKFCEKNNIRLIQM